MNSQAKGASTDSTGLSGPRFHKQLTDVGLYSLGGLCAVSLLQLFDEECHSTFKRKALEKILHDLGQPKQTSDSMFAILDGEIMNTSDVFVDSLLQEPVLAQERQPLVYDLITMAISEGCYDARMRVLIKHVAWQLRVTWDEMMEIEMVLAETLEYNTYTMSEEEAQEKAKKARGRKVKRYALIGLASVGGGAIIGLTGGLAAPLVAAGAGALIGGAGAAALGSAAGVAIIGSLFGVAGAGLTGYKMKRRVGAIEEFAFEPMTLIGSQQDSQRAVKQLHITIAVTGWLDQTTQDFRSPWSGLAESKEQYSLRWESKYLRQLGEAFDYILSTGISVATTEALKYTILSGLITAIAWPAALIAASGAIDNPWHVCTQRATEAGKQLAEVLLAREQGNRPLTLIGFSLGARVIFSCMEELAKRKGGEGLIEDIILLGAPVSGDPKYWQPLSRVVAGKIINGYSRGDWLLKFLFRTVSVTMNVAGLGPVKWDNRRMHNIDLSDIIDGHGDYIKNLDIIMKAVGVRTMDELKSPCFTKYTDQPSSSRKSPSPGKSPAAGAVSPTPGTCSKDTKHSSPEIASSNDTKLCDHEIDSEIASSKDARHSERYEFVTDIAQTNIASQNEIENRLDRKLERTESEIEYTSNDFELVNANHDSTSAVTMSHLKMEAPICRKDEKKAKSESDDSRQHGEVGGDVDTTTHDSTSSVDYDIEGANCMREKDSATDKYSVDKDSDKSNTEKDIGAVQDSIEGLDLHSEESGGYSGASQDREETETKTTQAVQGNMDSHLGGTGNDSGPQSGEDNAEAPDNACKNRSDNAKDVAGPSESRNDQVGETPADRSSDILKDSGAIPKDASKSSKTRRTLKSKKAAAKKLATQVKHEMKDKVSDALKSVHSNVKRTVKHGIEKRPGKRLVRENVSYSTTDKEVSVGNMKGLEAYATRNAAVGATGNTVAGAATGTTQVAPGAAGCAMDSDDSEGCYFTDSNPESDDDHDSGNDEGNAPQKVDD